MQRLSRYVILFIPFFSVKISKISIHFDEMWFDKSRVIR